jgi:hypothetical protein
MYNSIGYIYRNSGDFNHPMQYFSAATLPYFISLFQESEQSKEETDEELNKKLAQEATYANMARGLSTEVSSLLFSQSCI